MACDVSPVAVFFFTDPSLEKSKSRRKSELINNESLLEDGPRTERTLAAGPQDLSALFCHTYQTNQPSIATQPIQLGCAIPEEGIRITGRSTPTQTALSPFSISCLRQAGSSTKYHDINFEKNYFQLLAKIIISSSLLVIMPEFWATCLSFLGTLTF